MYVKYIILDGFKSYRDQTRIGPFDPHFNAITGLNGSGKSNILDGICFVLGISSMSVVRCKNLADCIYLGQGESLSKATVSIVLDNVDKSKSPPGQEHYNEVVVSRTVIKNGECRYYINRTTATKRNVTDLFESVQLNVNNPNFMIMQGKITKVVNMKPKEVLHMIEEAVGATLYQAKRDKAQTELNTKVATVDSIQGLIQENIRPSLLKQIQAHEAVQEFNIQTKEKNDRMRSYAIAHHYELVVNGNKSEQALNRILEQDQQDDECREQYKNEIKDLKRREEQMKQENTTRFKEKVDKAEKALKEQQKILREKEADVKTAKDGLDKAKKSVKEAEKTKHTEEKQIEDFKKKSSKALQEFEDLQEEKNHAVAELEKAREQETQLRAGKILDDEGKSVDVEQELNRVTSEITNLKPDLEDRRQRMAESSGKRTQLERQLKQTPSDDKVEQDYKEKEVVFERLKKEANKRNINAEESVMDIRNNLDASTRRLNTLTRDKATITNRNFNLSFNYDKSQIRPEGIQGCVYELVKINGLDEWGNAMETAVGGLMGQIVVDTDVIGKNLLKNGKLSRRVVIHPLNVFRSNYRRGPVTQAQLDQKFGPGNAIYALSLMEYNPAVKSVVEHFMGNKVLCKDMEIARHIAFKMNMKAYTTGGDFVDPGGIMQGGSRNNLGETIRDCANLYNINEELRKLTHDVNALTQKLEVAKSQENFIQQLEKAKRELHNADQMRKLTKYSQLKQEIEAIIEGQQQVGAELQELEVKFKGLEKERLQYQKKADQAENLREKNIRDNANLIRKWEKALDAATKKYEARQKHFNEIDMDLRSKQDFLNGCQKDIDDAIAVVGDCEQKLGKAQKAVEAFQEHFAGFQDAYDEAVAESNEWFEEAKQIQDKIKALDAKKEAAEINKMKRNNQRDTFQKEVDYCKTELLNLQEKFNDIDFTRYQKPQGGKSAAALRKELEKITKNLEEMQQRLDHDAAAALPTTRKEHDDAISKLTMIEKNKQNLQKAIDTLDKSKKQKVQAAYEDVNKKFNNMMQTLLPEANAKLVQVDPMDLSKGVNIHVQLGGVWKESLTELSGGQRSLVALSLVLSLCMYNPAPFYILDEVDAALDLSHTQNIGVVIQRQFKGTQFICVSLKDGMFSNANVLFTAKNEAGTSMVIRSARLNKDMPPPSNEDSTKKKKK